MTHGRHILHTHDKQCKMIHELFYKGYILEINKIMMGIHIGNIPEVYINSRKQLHCTIVPMRRKLCISYKVNLKDEYMYMCGVLAAIANTCFYRKSCKNTVRSLALKFENDGRKWEFEGVVIARFSLVLLLYIVKKKSVIEKISRNPEGS